MASTLSKIDASEYLINGVTLDLEALGLTIPATDLNALEGLTATIDELNTLDGITSTVDELNILDGVTATAAEINKLDGVASTTAEIDLRCFTCHQQEPTALDAYVMVPFDGQVTHIYVVSHGVGVGTTQVTCKNNAGSSMGAINLPNTAGGTNVIAPSSNNTFSANQKIWFDTTTAGTSHDPVSWTVRFQLT